jgi:quinoprotein glucose dehydrogenase
MAADSDNDLVFFPTSSPSVDYWGGARLGDNRYANSIVALKASTGRLVWSFQTVHHDLWDFDNAAPPAVVDLTLQGRLVPAVIQATKSGQLFVFNRLTGESLFQVTERAVPPSDASGERASPTQPFSALPPLSPLRVAEADLDTSDATLHAKCLALFRTLRNEGPFTPPSERGTLNSPAPLGGAHWGGVAFDPTRGIVVVPTNHIPSVAYLIPRDSAPDAANRTPSSTRLGLEYARMTGSPYILRREYFSMDGQPCTTAPLGSLHAIDLGTGQTVWNVPLGTGEGMERVGFAGGASMQGMVNLGGPISTASGLIFIGATPDAYLRAFDIASGRELWRGKLPAGARSTPSTYADRSGRQFVVIAAGGDGDFFGSSDEIVAFALPPR